MSAHEDGGAAMRAAFEKWMSDDGEMPGSIRGENVIPGIDEIVAMLLSGQCTREQAIGWLNRHMELATETEGLRDHFAGLAMQAAADPKVAYGFTFDQRAEWAYQQADAMLTARSALK